VTKRTRRDDAKGIHTSNVENILSCKTFLHRCLPKNEPKNDFKLVSDDDQVIPDIAPCELTQAHYSKICNAES
jgi:hypothetical protein